MTMTTDSKGIRILTPDDGCYLTNGNVYSKRVYLANDASPEDWEEITEAEAEQRMAEAEEETDEATEADYLEALAEMGVEV